MRDMMYLYNVPLYWNAKVGIFREQNKLFGRNLPYSAHFVSLEPLYDHCRPKKTLPAKEKRSAATKGSDTPLYIRERKKHRAEDGTRTRDPRITNALLYQLSHFGSAL
jgi:hypothetical protein